MPLLRMFVLGAFTVFSFRPATAQEEMAASTQSLVRGAHWR
jgi:hypothetical protein